MPPPSLPESTLSWRATFAAAIKDISHDSGHPLQIALRTYSLSLSLALSPVLLPAILALLVRPKIFTARVRVFWRALLRELHPTGFAPAITTAVAGGVALQRLWNSPQRRQTHHWLPLFLKTLLANAISSTFAVTLLRWRRHRRLGAISPTLDLSLLFLVRALDASVQAFLLRKGREIAARRVHASSRGDAALQPSSIPSTSADTKLFDKQSEAFAKEWQNKLAVHLDTFVFWASSARFVMVHLPRQPCSNRLFLHRRIMWCFVYQPQR